MISLDPSDDVLSGLERADVPSTVAPDVSYRLGRPLGEGGMSVAFYAVRLSPGGKTPVVVKLLRPSFVRQSGELAGLIVRKEAVALGRLNERVPPTPFVVRLLDTGELTVEQGGGTVDLPWLALEYVRGGSEGTTLRERVRTSIRLTQRAFDLRRAGAAIDGIAAGLHAVHEVGVVHRDLKPDNILCCGHGHGEILKVADFGVARPVGMVGTFGGTLVGTPGYAAPELFGFDTAGTGPWTDVFALGAMAYFILTGNEYFDVRTPAEALRAARSPSRRALRDAAETLPDELREVPSACEAIDRALRRATMPDPTQRPQTAEAFADEIGRWLRVDSTRARAVVLRDSATAELQTLRLDWTWFARSDGGASLAVTAAAWDSDGQALALTSRGLSFWDGTSWCDADAHPSPSDVHFVHRVGPGRWLVGGDGGSLAVYRTGGVEVVARLPDATAVLHQFAGSLEQVAIAAGVSARGHAILYGIVGGRWLKPFVIPDAVKVTGLAQIGDDSFLVAGEGVNGGGFVAEYAPLSWEFRRHSIERLGRLVSCAAVRDLGCGVATGLDGAAVWIQAGEPHVERVSDDVDLTTCALDEMGQAWVGARGRIHVRELFGPDGRPRWRTFWKDSRWTSPFVSLFVEEGRVIALTANGGVIEGLARSLQDPARRDTELA